MNHARRIAAFAIAGTATLAAGQGITTFDSGTEGWSVSGRDDIAQTGNPGAGLDVDVIEVFGADIRNTDNPAFQGDYTRFNAPIELTVDIKVNSINSPFNPAQVDRELIVEIRDNTNTNGYPYTSVYYSLGVLDATVNSDWTTYSVIIDDPSSLALPAGWRGTGGEDPVTFEPILEPGRTFASVLESVDSLHFTTLVPGFFYGFTNFDLQVDNVGFRVIPAPASAGLLGLAGLAAVRRRR